MRICEPNASGSFHRGILSHISSLLLRKPPLLTFDCQPPFLCLSTFLLSAFFFIYSSSFSIPALIFLLVSWQRHGWPNCGFWRAPCVWSRHRRCQGGHVRSSLALCGAGCGGAWMDVWMNGWMGMGCWHAL